MSMAIIQSILQHQCEEDGTADIYIPYVSVMMQVAVILLNQLSDEKILEL